MLLDGTCQQPGVARLDQESLQDVMLVAGARHGNGAKPWLPYLGATRMFRGAHGAC